MENSQAAGGAAPVATAKHRTIRRLWRPTCAAIRLSEDTVLHKCANPDCEIPFRRLTEGKLFLLERSTLTGQQGNGKRHTQSRIEYYWLCDQCKPHFTLADEPGRGILAVPMIDAPRKRSAAEIEPPDGDRTGGGVYAKGA
jgi:hypothetical protein